MSEKREHFPGGIGSALERQLVEESRLPQPHSPEVRVVEGQHEDLCRLQESLEILADRLVNKLAPADDDGDGNEGGCGEKVASTVLDKMASNNRHINRLNALVMDLTKRYQP